MDQNSLTGNDRTFGENKSNLTMRRKWIKNDFSSRAFNHLNGSKFISPYKFSEHESFKCAYLEILFNS